MNGIFRQRRVHALHHVDVRFSAPIIGDFVREFLPVAGRAAPVDHQRHVTRGGKYLRVPAVAPRVRPHRLRPAVQQHQQRIFLRGIEFRRPDQHRLYFGSFRAIEPERLRRIHLQLRQQRVIRVRDLPQPASIARCDKQFRRHASGWCASAAASCRPRSARFRR